MKCNTCDTKFKPIPGCEVTEQANGCAATLYMKDYDHYILAHYGSDYDMQRYLLKPALYTPGNICDNCIKALILDGSAQLIEDGVW